MNYSAKVVTLSVILCIMVTLSTAATFNVSDLAWVQITNGWGPVEKDKSVNEQPAGDGRILTLNGVTYAKGLGAHANSEIKVPLNNNYETFTSDIGIDDEVGTGGSACFIVKLDGVEKYRSPALTGASATVTIPPITVVGGIDLRLIVDMNGNATSDHADWCNPTLTSNPLPPPPPNITITASTLLGTTPLTVDFTATNTGGPVTSWLWTFGDASTAIVQNPSHTYTNQATQYVACVATGPGGTVTKTLTIITYPPNITITANPVLGTIPLLVSFTATNTGSIVTSWAWDFGDGATDNGQNPNHTYTTVGVFVARCTATGPGGVSTTTVNLLAKPLPPDIIITATPTTGVAPFFVTFSAVNSGGPVTSWGWNFYGDDGFNAVTQNTTHTYNAPGLYGAYCTATGPGGSNTKTVFISILPTGIPNQVLTLDASSTPQWADNTIIRDIDGNVYHTVVLGSQTWTVENLKTTKFRDGTNIPMTSNQGELNLAPRYCYYDDNAANKDIYGLLYNWYAITDPAGLAPAGWHVPTTAEWETLENYLIASGHNWDRTTAGNKVAKSMAAQRLWGFSVANMDGDVGKDILKNNVSGFAGLPNGFNRCDGSFGDLGIRSYWWSTTEVVVGMLTLIEVRGMWRETPDLRDFFWLKSDALAIRLIRD